MRPWHAVLHFFQQSTVKKEVILDAQHQTAQTEDSHTVGLFINFHVQVPSSAGFCSRHESRPPLEGVIAMHIGTCIAPVLCTRRGTSTRVLSCCNDYQTVPEFANMIFCLSVGSVTNRRLCCCLSFCFSPHPDPSQAALSLTMKHSDHQ